MTLNYGEFPKSILFVLAVSLEHVTEFIPAFNVHSFQRHVDSFPCSQPRAQLLKKAHQKKKDPRATSCDENDQYSLFYCIVARRAALLNMNCFEQWLAFAESNGTQEKTKGPQTPPNSRGTKSRHANKYTHRPKTNIHGIHQHVDLSRHINTGIFHIYKFFNDLWWFTYLRFILLTPRLAWSITKRPASFTTQKILTNFGVVKKFTSSTRGETSASAEFSPWPTTLAGA